MFDTKNDQHQHFLILLAFSLIYGTWWWQTLSLVILISGVLFIGLYWLLKLNIKQYCQTILIGLSITWLINHWWPVSNHFWLTQWWSEHNFLQQILTRFINNNYVPARADLINQLLFNEINWQSQISQTFQQLSVLHLLVISGLHILVIYQIIMKLAGQNQIAHWAIMIFFLIYWVAIDFSYSLFRAILSLYFSRKLKYQSWYSTWTYTALLSLMFHPRIYGTITFMLSSGITLMIALINHCCFESSIIKGILMNITISSYVTLILLPKTHRFYPFMILNNLILTPIVIFLYFYLLVSFFNVWLIPLTNMILSMFFWLINNLSINKIYLFLDFWTPLYSQITMVLLIMLGFLGYYRFIYAYQNDRLIKHQKVW